MKTEQKKNVMGMLTMGADMLRNQLGVMGKNLRKSRKKNKQSWLSSTWKSEDKLWCYRQARKPRSSFSPVYVRTYSSNIAFDPYVLAYTTYRGLTEGAVRRAYLPLQHGDFIREQADNVALPKGLGQEEAHGGAHSGEQAGQQQSFIRAEYRSRENVLENGKRNKRLLFVLGSGMQI